ncbi:hypothetical protein [Streptomyces yaizuensis]|uniref:Uncharacterized protein n=1 Tax=Streptomyces yaizuensis TaxID=2989713 RepID=A0ABQ5P5P9_9ACTN|nr:hypothetical protein [Streptomyces sp. YSPA8]GLF97922.1 hypothetical protein SYYSPA8_26515 [Streptomyces sp. YSPA8]
MSPRGEVCLGDLARAVAVLRPADARSTAAVARLLGFAPRTTDGPGTREPEPVGTRAVPPSPATEFDGPTAPDGPAPVALPRDPVPVPALAGARPPVPVPAPGPERTDTTPGERAARLAERPLDFSLTPVDGLLGTTLTTAARDGDDGGDDGGDGPSASGLLRRTGTTTTALPHEPPWNRDWARGVTVAAVSTPVESREFDERALLRSVARQNALVSVPRRARLTARRGVQLLLDHGPGMAPFQDDRDWLRELVASVAGRDRVEVLRFRGTPARGVVRDDPLTREPYRPPQPGTPVVLFSDLGRLRPPFTGRTAARPGEWERFTDSVTHSGCPVVCLTPYPDTDYPAALRRTVALVPLDRSLSLGHAREITARVRRARERA